MAVDSVNGQTGVVEITADNIDGVVKQVAGKSGVVTLTVADIADAAPKISPSFTGAPTAPTPVVSDASSRIATTQFVHDVLGDSANLVKSVNGKTDVVSLAVGDIPGAAPVTSPAFNGEPTSPTFVVSDKSNKIATTQFVHDVIGNGGGAPIDSPVFTGQPQAPTAVAGTNNGQIATTAFVQTALASVSGGSGSPTIVKHLTEDTSRVIVNFNQSSGDGWGVAHVRLAVAAVSANGATVGGAAKEYLLKVKSDTTTSIISAIRDDAAISGLLTVNNFANRTEFVYKSNVQGGTHLWAVEVHGIASVSLTSDTPTSTGGNTGGGGTGGGGTSAGPRPTGADNTKYAPYSLNEEFDTDVLNPNVWNKRSYNGSDNALQNWSVAGGNLNLWPDQDGSGNWVERVIDSDGKFYMTYGFLEIEAKIPAGKGVRVVAALMNHDLSGEYYIALCEMYPGGGVNSWWSDSDTNLHANNYKYGFRTFSVTDSESNWRYLRNYKEGEDLSSGFHKYGLHWDASGIQGYYDGQPLGAKVSTGNLTDRAYISIQLLYGSASRDPDSTTPKGVSNAFKINYVRAWPLATATNPAPTPAPTTKKVAYCGDATIWGQDGASGTGARVSRPEPQQFMISLPSSPPYDVVNEGVQGNTMSKVLNGNDGVHQPWNNFIANTDASIVILNCCIGDTYESGNSVATYKTNLRQIIDLTIAQNKGIILQTPNETNDSQVDAYRQAMLDVASEKGVYVIDVYTYISNYRTNNSLTVNNMYPDGTHPNQATYDLIGKYAASRFSQIMSSTPTTSDNGYIAPVGRSASDYPVMSFNEEFEGTSLNSSLWNTHLWYEGEPGLNNYNVKNGVLQMWVLQNPDGSFLLHNRTIDTDYKFEQQFGYFEAEMKLPYGWGQWPAFWLYAHRDAQGNEADIRPEIDIMEAYTGGGWEGAWSGHDANGNENWHPINYAGTCHDQKQDPIAGYTIGGTLYPSDNEAGWPDLSAQFHTYGCHWGPEGVQFYFDGKPFGQLINTSGSHTVPMYILLDLWTADAEHPYAGIPDSRTPQSESRAFQVKYVRAWKLPSGSSTRGSYNMPQIQYNSSGTTPVPSPSTSMQAHTVDYYGSSFVRGYDGGNNGAQVAHPVPSYLAEAFPQLTVRNEGVDSNTTGKLIDGTDGVHPAWTTQMANSDASIVIIGSFGYTDSTTLTDTQWRSNLTTLFNGANSAGKKVIFVTVHKTDPSTGVDTGPFAQSMKEVAQSLGAGFIDMLTYTTQQFTGNIRDWVPDGYHPSQPGYTIIGKKVAAEYQAIYNALTGNTSTGGGSNGGSTGGGTTPSVDPVPQGVPSSWVGDMCFREDFNGTSLNSSYWYPSMPYESETQDPNNTYGNANFSMVNYKVSNGTLKIWPETDQNGNFFRKTISTEGKFFIKYGIFEARMKMPRGRGCWPAFWLYSTEYNDPTYRPEIDIMEAYPGGGVSGYWGTADLQANNYSANVWAPPWNGGNQTNLGERKMSDFMSLRNLTDSFHYYGCVWNANGISFFFDGVQVGSVIPTNEMSYREYILLDLWFGSASGAPNVQETPRGESNSFEIDYVYAWKLKDGSTQLSGTAPAYNPNTGTGAGTTTTGGTTTNTGNSITPYNMPTTGWTLTLNSEFSTTQAAPDTAKWSTDIFWKPNNSVTNYDVSGGNLRIWPALNGSAFFDRTFVTDAGKFSQTYGFFEIRAKLPVGAGLHPVAGLIDSNGREISFMHAYCGAPNGGWSNSALHAVDVGNAVWRASDNAIVDFRGSSYASIPDLSGDFHIYGVRWDSTTVKFYLDGNQVGPTINHTEITTPLYYYIGLWINAGGGFNAATGSGTPSSSNPYTPIGSDNSLLVDYVRAWQFA